MGATKHYRKATALRKRREALQFGEEAFADDGGIPPSFWGEKGPPAGTPAELAKRARGHYLAAQCAEDRREERREQRNKENEQRLVNFFIRWVAGD